MRVERVSLAESVKSNPHTTQTQGTVSSSGVTPPFRIAERQNSGRVQRLVDLAFTMLKEAEFLARDKSFSEETSRIQSLNLAEGIDFYGEVERFEVGLIKRALEQTAGNQARAAKLLRIKPTTLNSKIKLYNIEF
jgi:DNA-binding NtrC family response regulator